MSAFDKIIGYEDVKTELMRFCDVLKDPERYRKLGVKYVTVQACIDDCRMYLFWQSRSLSRTEFSLMLWLKN